MTKFNHHFSRKHIVGLLTVCEQPLNKPCSANQTRIGCVLLDCCFFMDACYKKTLPGHLMVFYSLITIIIILFWGMLGFWFCKNRKLKKKLADIEESPTKIATSNITEEEQGLAGTSQVQECNKEAGLRSSK
ncbi:testis-expressed protein 29 [Dendropsophus ebraccatus]|uniref:testis-expressed protein 29 n=1 Tax=Dendropsophus ebraccatus TaxID=150705 RepID=UPI0038318F98